MPTIDQNSKLNMLAHDNERLRQTLEQIRNKIGGLALMKNDETGYILTRAALSGCLDLIRETLNPISNK